MKNRLLVAVLMLCTFTLAAQEQKGIVKTIGRPGQPGIPLDSVLVRVQGKANVTVSDSDGKFALVLDHYEEGQAYSLSRVSRFGYQLADGGVIGRQYPYSEDVRLEISMVSNADYNRTKNEIENSVRARMEAEYRQLTNELKRQLEDKIISEAAHMQKICELDDYYNNVDNLIERLADRYARTDYDRLDSLDIRINSLIEKGELDEAERLIKSKDTKKALDQLSKNNEILEETLAAGRKAQAELTQEYASELLMRFDIATMRFDNVSAAAYLKERMELDTTNVEWRMEYATFIRDYLGRYDEAIELYRGLLETATDAQTLAEIYGSLGNVYQITGRFDDALLSYRTSAEIRECDTLSRERLASSYQNLSSVYLTLEKYEEADHYLQMAEEIYKEYQDTLGLAAVYNKLSVKYSDKGEYAKAEEALMKSLSLRLEALGENNLKVAEEYANCALLMQDLNRLDEASEYVGKAISIRSKILGDDHPDVADVYQIQASILMEKEDYSSALQYYEKALDIFTRFYGDVHPEVASLYDALAHYNNAVTNDFKKAKDYYAKALEMNRQLYGDTHSATAIGLNNLADVYCELAEYEVGLELYEQALAIWKSIYGDKHKSVADVYNNLASTYSHLGQYEKAVEYQENALEIYLEVYGGAHSYVGLAYHNLGGIYEMLGDDQKAMDFLAQALSIYMGVYGENHSSTASTYDQIGQIYYKHKMYDNAESFMEKSLNIRRLCLGECHDEVAISYNNLALLYQAKENYVAAEEMFIKAMEIHKSLLGPDHPSVATIMTNLGGLYQKRKQYDEALEYMVPALKIVEDAYSDDHPTVVLYRYGLALLYYEAGEFGKALPYLKNVYYDSLEKTGPEDRRTTYYHNFLNQLYFNIMREEDYDGSLDEDFHSFNRNTIVTASVVDDSQASGIGLSGTYYVMAFEDWRLGQDDVNFFVYNTSLSSQKAKTYVFFRDGDYVIVPFEGSLGVRLSPDWISIEEKSVLISDFKKWYRKNRKKL